LRQEKTPKVDVEKSKSIYKLLSHHYITRRSVLFIIDTQYSSQFYKQKAIALVAQVFKELSPSDYFGLICLGIDTQDIVLEEKQANIIAKEKMIQEMV